jgi:uncharacterized protein YeaO (DUF488 family)
MLSIYTIQIRVAQKLKLTNNSHYLDTTVKSGDKTFAPNWNIVMGVKHGRITPAEYTKEYRKMMEESYEKKYFRWEEVLALEKIILACYCRSDNFCHRYLLKDLLIEYGQARYIREIKTIEDFAD